MPKAIQKEKLLKELDLRSLGKFYLVANRKYFCSVCGKETFRPRICRECFIKEEKLSFQNS